jgi:thymidylate synthase
MRSYQDLVEHILNTGQRKHNRTGIDTKTVAGYMFSHDMSTGFPLLTTKKVPFRLIASELEFFIKGITDKHRLITRNNHIRDERCSPDLIPYSHDPETQTAMKSERELWPIYGFQWRNFWGTYTNYDQLEVKDGVDQLATLIHTLKTNPNDRRMIITARNPQALHRQALPPCHYGFQVTVINNKLNLLRNQRSVDVGLGLPFNIASYALLLHLLAKEAGLEEGQLIGFLADTHIYANHIDALTEQCQRIPSELPSISTDTFSSIFDWEYTDTIVENYHPQRTLKMSVAV